MTLNPEFHLQPSSTRTVRRVLLLTLLLLPSVWLLGCTGEGTDSDAEGAGEAALIGQDAFEHALKHLDPEYTCPMHPEIVEDEPGSCPICGMDLVEVRADRRGEGSEASPAVELGGRLTQQLGVRTEAVRIEALRPQLHTVARFESDPRREQRLQARVQGWVREVVVAGPGEPVAVGETLLTLYSPELVNAQREYLRARRSGDRDLLAAASARLAALGVDAEVRGRIDAAGEPLEAVPMVARQAGVVTELSVRAGQAIAPETALVTVVDLSRIWAIAEVFPGDRPMIREGLPVTVVPHQRPWQRLEGTIERLQPEADPVSRTVAVRIPLDNPDGDLHPGLFGRATIQGPERRGLLTVAKEAVIRTGEATRVILDEGEGRFRPRVVRTGISVEGRTAILDGLHEGERVVVSGQFLIDSEASARAGGHRLEGHGDVDAPAEHGGDH